MRTLSLSPIGQDRSAVVRDDRFLLTRITPSQTDPALTGFWDYCLEQAPRAKNTRIVTSTMGTAPGDGPRLELLWERMHLKNCLVALANFVRRTVNVKCAAIASRIPARLRPTGARRIFALVQGICRRVSARKNSWQTGNVRRGTNFLCGSTSKRRHR